MLRWIFHKKKLTLIGLNAQEMAMKAASKTNKIKNPNATRSSSLTESSPLLNGFGLNSSNALLQRTLNFSFLLYFFTSFDLLRLNTSRRTSSEVFLLCFTNNCSVSEHLVLLKSGFVLKKVAWSVISASFCLQKISAFFSLIFDLEIKNSVFPSWTLQAKPKSYFMN